MARLTLNNALRSEYTQLFDTCLVDPAQQRGVDFCARAVQSGRPQYEDVGSPLGVPWFMVGVIHGMESGFSFQRHLHNGDPLAARTVQVPAGRPRSGAPPFTWVESALDALRIQRLDKWTDWGIAGMLYQLEAYNGFGYRTRHPETLTPYLWSFSNHYTSGKYVADGTWSATAKSKQCGAAVILRRLAEMGVIHFSATGEPQVQSPGELEPLVRYSMTERSDAAAQLQAALNRFPGVFLREDGVPGKATSDACLRVLGHYLAGDPRSQHG